MNKCVLNHHFNSIKVQLELSDFAPSIMCCSFQFHKGTIRTLKIIIKVLIYAYFNSIKVQLEHAYRENPNYSPTFQFHKGTIRTSFHKGVFTQSYISIP